MCEFRIVMGPFPPWAQVFVKHKQNRTAASARSVARRRLRESGYRCYGEKCPVTDMIRIGEYWTGDCLVNEKDGNRLT